MRRTSAGLASGPSRSSAISTVESSASGVSAIWRVREPCELGDQVALVGRVLGPVRDDEQDRQPAEIVGDVTDQLAARRIDPVQVVDHEDQPRPQRDMRQELDDRFEQQGLTIGFVDAAGIGLVE